MRIVWHLDLVRNFPQDIMMLILYCDIPVAKLWSHLEQSGDNLSTRSDLIARDNFGLTTKKLRNKEVGTE